jgi:hypothetical protein
MIFAQQYYQASGQTQVFTLTAGAKVGPTAVLPHGRLTTSIAPHMLVTMQNGGASQHTWYSGKWPGFHLQPCGQAGANSGNRGQFVGSSQVRSFRWRVFRPA